MKLNIGDLVTRKSHNNDVIFKIINISNEKVLLKGVDLRLYADAFYDDLIKVEAKYENDDRKIINDNILDCNLNRNEFFYIPGIIVHIDGDKEFLNRCMNYYKELNVRAYGFSLKEKDIPNQILDILNKYKPDILVITGHDAYYNGRKNEYQNSAKFIDAVKVARKFEKDHNKLIIISGACQSNYEELIRAGSNFASSPKRINIHALDPAIVASSVALSEKNKSIDLIPLINKTKFGSDGIGGIFTNGTMYVGYPR